MNTISKKKIQYKIHSPLRKYLKDYSRAIGIPVKYSDLLDYPNSMPLQDKKGDDTLWETVLYNESEMRELNISLTKIYALLKTEGNVSVMEHLYADRIDFCPFGNSKPFRIKIVNRFNDNYDYFYLKKADASRIYGLELEHILSPNRINYLVDGKTLIEEHIVGIPGDQFIKNNLKRSNTNKIRLAKEFIKFNERVFVRLLGDMRSYNYIVDVTPDFDDIQYRIRAIDFDQQSYEGQKTLYLPQYFKENNPFVELCIKHMTIETIKQYQMEEDTLIANRIRVSKYRAKDLFDIMVADEISLKEKVIQLREELQAHYKDKSFLSCKTMGELVKQSLYTSLNRAS